MEVEPAAVNLNTITPEEDVKSRNLDDDDVVKTGDYVIIEKQNFRKVCKVTETGTFRLGKEHVETGEIIGKKFWSGFKMIILENEKYRVKLEAVNNSEIIQSNFNESSASGVDNRSLFDDGKSQKLSKSEIENLRESGKSGKEIVSCLIENSKTFSSKTEYSQAKYIKKKEKKYFRYIRILKPTLSMLQDIYFHQDHSKISNLRMDILSQILSHCDVKYNGSYLLLDSGSCGLMPAGLLNRIGSDTKGSLIYLHVGNQPQLTLVQAMNFPDEQLKRMYCANIYSFLRFYHQGEEKIMNNLIKKHEEKLKDATNGEYPIQSKRLKLENGVEDLKEENLVQQTAYRIPKWFYATKEAVSLIQTKKVDGLVIVAKEHPLNIINELLPFLGLSRPFVIFHSHREPLQETYIELRKRRDVINLKLITNFCRRYQVLSNRTHPNITTDDLSGYLLIGYYVSVLS